MRRVKKKIDLYSWYTWVFYIIFKGLRRNKNHIRQSRFLFQSSNRLVTPDFQPHFEPRRFYIYNRPTCCQNIRTRSVLIALPKCMQCSRRCVVTVWWWQPPCQNLQRLYGNSKEDRQVLLPYNGFCRQTMHDNEKKSRRNNEDNEDISKRNNVIWRQIGCEHSQNYTIGFHQRYI